VLIEGVLDEGIDSALPAGTPDEFKRLRLPARLALAEALELLTPEVARAIKGLAAIRNEFAHGLRDDFTQMDAERMANAIRPFMGMCSRSTSTVKATRCESLSESFGT
jgi:hypothetical protein